MSEQTVALCRLRFASLKEVVRSRFTVCHSIYKVENHVTFCSYFVPVFGQNR